MAHMPGGHQPGGHEPEGHHPGDGASSPVPASGFYSEGTLVDEDGVVQVETVAEGYVPISGDIHILGTLHTWDGKMYVTEDTITVGTDVLINGIRHTASGVRRVIYAQPLGVGQSLISKGFRALTSTGIQLVEASGSGNIDHGILRNNDNEMIVNDSTP